MGNIRLDLANFLTISLAAFAGVWLINRGLEKAGLTSFKA
jgi:hypothetical protein